MQLTSPLFSTVLRIRRRGSYPRPQGFESLLCYHGIVDQFGRVAWSRSKRLRVQISPMPPGGTMETLVVEIHAAEGGADAKLLIVEQLGVYKKYCIRRHL